VSHPSQTIARLGSAVTEFVEELSALAAEATRQLDEPDEQWSIHDFLQRYGEILEDAIDAYQDLAAEAGLSIDPEDGEDVLAVIAGTPSAN
jgi:hypothetical protein